MGRAGYSVRRLAAELDVDRKAIYRWRNGTVRTVQSPVHRANLAERLGTPADYFAGPSARERQDLLEARLERLERAVFGEAR
jgi:transcriptional regulator with XRE-family HTH domain